MSPPDFIIQTMHSSGMSASRMLRRSLLCLAVIMAGVLVQNQESIGMESGNQFARRGREAAPHVKRIADQYLLAQGHDPLRLVAAVWLWGRGTNDDWRVDYWHTSPSDDYPSVAHSDVEVYISHEGRPRLVVNQASPPAEIRPSPRRQAADRVLLDHGYDPAQFQAMEWFCIDWHVDYWDSRLSSSAVLSHDPTLRVDFDSTRQTRLQILDPSVPKRPL